MQTRVMFLRDIENKPVGCLSMIIDRKNHRVKYQYSVQNPVDHFDRKLARHLALGRLVDQPIVIPLPRNSDQNMTTITRLVMQDLSQLNAPSRAIKAAKLWLQFLPDMFV